MSTTAETAVPLVVDMPVAVRAAIAASPRVVIPASRAELYKLALGPDGGPVFSVDYEANGETVTEATVTRCRNGSRTGAVWLMTCETVPNDTPAIFAIW